MVEKSERLVCNPSGYNGSSSKCLPWYLEPLEEPVVLLS